MTSLTADEGKNGRTWRVQVTVAGARKAIRLGRLPKKQADAVLRHVEALSASRIDGSAPPEATSHWLAGIDDGLRERLVKAGLADARDVALTMTIGELINDYINKRFARLQRSTQQVHEQAFGAMRMVIGADTPILDVTPADAEDFREALLAGGYAEATVRRRCSVASMLFRYARRRRWIDRDPFDDAEVPRSAVATKHHAFITTEDAHAKLEQLPNLEWRLLFALSRWGGLRVGSEPRRLTWADIDWARHRFRVESSRRRPHTTRARASDGRRSFPSWPHCSAKPLRLPRKARRSCCRCLSAVRTPHSARRCYERSAIQV